MRTGTNLEISRREPSARTDGGARGARHDPHAGDASTVTRPCSPVWPPDLTQSLHMRVHWRASLALLLCLVRKTSCGRVLRCRMSNEYVMSPARLPLHDGRSLGSWPPQM